MIKKPVDCDKRAPCVTSRETPKQMSPVGPLPSVMRVFDFLQRSHGPAHFHRFSSTQFQTPLFLKLYLHLYCKVDTTFKNKIK